MVAYFIINLNLMYLNILIMKGRPPPRHSFTCML